MMIFTVPNFMFHVSLSVEYSSIDKDITVSIKTVETLGLESLLFQLHSF